MRKTFRKRISIILAAMLLVTSCPINVFAEEQVELPVAESSETLETNEVANTLEESKSELVELMEEPELIYDAGETTESEATYELATASNAELEEDKEVKIEEVSETTSSDATYFDCTSEEIDGIKVRVTALEGVFPADSKLVVKKVSSSNEDKKDIDAAIDNAKLLEDEEEKNEPDTYTFDIKVVDKDGNELQPADGAEVKVTFERVDNSKALLDAKVYHLEESDEKKIEELEELIKEANEADDEDDFDYSLLDGEVIDNVSEGHRKVEDQALALIREHEEGTDALVYKDTAFEAVELDTQVKEESSVVETTTEGFSYYVVEFYYGNYEYILEGDSEIALSVILEALGLKDVIDETKITAIEVSDETLFAPIHKAVDVNDETKGYAWYIQALKPFNTEEKMTITADGKVYEIKVTDDSYVAELISGSRTTQYTTLQAAITASTSGDTVKLLQDITITTSLNVVSGKNLTLDLNGCTVDAQNKCQIITNAGTLIVDDSTTEKKGTLTNGKRGIENKGTLTFNAGSITNCIKGVDRGGGIHNTSGSTLTMNGGTIDNCQVSWVGGGIFNDAGTAAATTTINGGTISNCVAGTGPGVFNAYNGAKLTITGGTINNSVVSYRSVNTLIVTGGTISAIGQADSNTRKLSITGGTIKSLSAANNKISLNVNGGNPISAATIGSDTCCVAMNGLTYALPTPTKAGCFFEGWKDQNNKIHNAGENVGSAALTLTAQWTEAPVEVDSGSGSTIYHTLAEAVAAAQSGDTIKLLKDISEESTGYTVASGVTLDVAGKTLTVGDIIVNGTLADTGNGDGAAVLMNGELIASGNLYMPLYDTALSTSSEGYAYRLYKYGISMSKASNSSYLNIQTKIILYNSDGATKSAKGYSLLKDDENGGKLIHMTRVTIPQADKTQKTTEYRHTAAHTKEFGSYYADSVDSTKVFSIKFTNHKAQAGKIIKVSSNWEVADGAFTYNKSYGNVYIKINADGSTSWSNSTAYKAQFN